MTFISGVRIAEKLHNGAGWRSWLTKQMSRHLSRSWNVFSDRLMSRSADASNKSKTRCPAIAERPRCGVRYGFRQK